MLQVTHSSYEEHQHFRQWWIWSILLIIEGLVLAVLIAQLAFDRPVGDSPAPNWVLILYGLLVLSLLAMFYLLRLDIFIDRMGIRFRWRPFQSKGRMIYWRDIEKAYVRKYKPIREYGGWGIRFGILRKGIAHNVSGNMGLQLVLKNRKKILLGTQHANQLETFLENREESVEDSTEL